MFCKRPPQHELARQHEDIQGEEVEALALLSSSGVPVITFFVLATRTQCYALVKIDLPISTACACEAFKLVCQPVSLERPRVAA